MSNLIVMCEFGGMGMIRDLRFEKNYIRDHRRAVVLVISFLLITFILRFNIHSFLLF